MLAAFSELLPAMLTVHPIIPTFSRYSNNKYQDESLAFQAGGGGVEGCTFILSMQASIFSCSTAFLAWEMLAVLLLAMPSFMLLLWGG